MTRWFPPALLGSALVFACTDRSDSTHVDPDAGDGTQLLSEQRSALARLEPSPGAERDVSADLALFAWQFSKEISDGRSNFVFSPYSISVACAMLSAGAAGTTLSAIQTALDFSQTGDALHTGYNALSGALAERNHAAAPRSIYNAQILQATNDFWMATELRPSQAFLDTLALYYGAGAFLAPFSSQPELARGAINDRIREQTEGLIPELLPGGSIQRQTLFVLTNSLYLRAFWSEQFPKENTAPAPFTALDGTVRPVDTMHRLLEAGYLAGEGFFALSLPYERRELEMLFIVPELGQFLDFRQAFGAEQARALGDLALTAVDLSLPKFSIDSQTKLGDALSRRGMARAFASDADLDAIHRDAFVDNVFHDVNIAIDERGTIAAAATAVTGGGAGPPPIPIAVAIDRPFIFFIRDRATDAVLFLGQVVSLP